MSAAKKAVRRPVQQRPDAQNDPEVDQTEEEELDTEQETPEEPAESDADGSEDHEEGKSSAVAATEPEFIPGAPKDGRTFMVGKPVYFKGRQQGNSVVVTESIYRASLFPGSDRWKFNLLYPAGTVLPANRAKQRDDDYFDAVLD